MTVTVFSRTAASALGLGLAALALPSAAQAQGAYPVAAPMDARDIEALPSEYRNAPRVFQDAETMIGPDGVETITRTRRIEYPATAGEWHSQSGEVHAVGGHHGAGYGVGYGPGYGYAPGGAVFEREQWLEECERRTSGRDDREKGGIIGGLLGAIAGGIAGNEIAGSGDKLGGTLLGAGLGGIGGLLIGSLIGGGRDRDGDYDCEAALNGYLSQYGYPGGPVHYAPPVHHNYGYGYGYAPAYSYGYSYAPPQQVVYVPVQYMQQQRVIVRETVREEIIPGAVRQIQPVPRPVKADPIPVKREPIPVKGY